ncbi:dipeptidyl aminopeptidase/acylaminoacyl peptidase [Sphingomonas zeicaulis]|uniref:Atxe2 family lasso peptide isopeptidase n=1 Tax=Sphingomonas zeicaulis TaxID=1632740 RepID=UPI003D207864
MATSADLATVIDISGVTVSPDRRWVAYRIERPSLERDAIPTEWFVASTKAAADPPRQIGDGGNAEWSDAGVVQPGAVQWSPDSRALYYRAVSDRGVELRMAMVGGAGSRTLVSDDADVEDFQLLSDGRILFSTGATRDEIAQAEQAERDGGILIDGRATLSQSLFRGDQTARRRATLRYSGEWFDRRGLLADVTPHLRLVDPTSGLITDAAAMAAQWIGGGLRERGAGASATDGSTIVTADRSTAGNGVSIQRDGKVIARCTVGACNDRVTSLAWAGGRAPVLLAIAGADHAQSLALWAPRSKRVEWLVRGGGLLNGGRQAEAPCAVTVDAAFCVEAASLTPPRLVRFGFDGSNRVVHAPNAGLRLGGLVRERMEWRDSAGRTITAQLIRPTGAGRTPLFINYYRCEGFLRGGLGDEWPLVPLAAEGIAALCINAPPVSAAPDPAGQRYATGLEAVRTVVGRLAARGLVDPDNVGMGGLSFGSEVAFWIATHSDLLAAVSIASVQMEPGYYWLNAPADRPDFAKNLSARWGLADPETDPAAWMRLPSMNTQNLSAPVLMQLPEIEARSVARLQVRLSAAAMGELHVFPDAPHIKVLPRQKRAAYERNLDWFRFWLLGRSDPSPLKAAQYERWRRLRPWHHRQDSTEPIHSSRSTSSSNRK